MQEARYSARYSRRLRQRAMHIQEIPGDDEDEEDEDDMQTRNHRPDDWTRLDRTDLEELFLGGRRNAVTRMTQKYGEWLAYELWWEEADGKDDTGDESSDLGLPTPFGWRTSPGSPSESEWDSL